MVFGTFKMFATKRSIKLNFLLNIHFLSVIRCNRLHLEIQNIWFFCLLQEIFIAFMTFSFCFVLFASNDSVWFV